PSPGARPRRRTSREAVFVNEPLTHPADNPANHQGFRHQAIRRMVKALSLDARRMKQRHQALVRFDQVGLRYGVGPEVLSDLSFQIEPRSFQFLTGPSGAGKTTLLKLLFLGLRPTRGLVTVFGRD